MVSSDPLGETREIGMLLHRAAAATLADFARATDTLGLTAPMARVLLLLDEPMSMRSIAASMRVDASYVTGIADQLEAAGFAVREPGRDRRVKNLAATEAGAAAKAKIADAVAAESTALNALDAEARAQLTELLERLVGR